MSLSDAPSEKSDWTVSGGGWMSDYYQPASAMFLRMEADDPPPVG